MKFKYSKHSITLWGACHFVQINDYYLYWLIPTCAEINSGCTDNFHEMALCYEMFMNCSSPFKLNMLKQVILLLKCVFSQHEALFLLYVCTFTKTETWASLLQNQVLLLIVVGGLHCQGFVFVSSCVYTVVIFVSRWPIYSSDFGSYSN